VNWYTERNDFDNVSSLYNCKIGFRFTVASGNTFEPHPSFGYNRFVNIKTNPGAGQTAVSLENDSTLYNSTVTMTVNAGDPTSIIWHEQDNAEAYGLDLHLFGEGQAQYTLDLESATNRVPSL
jgi:hypothetical protein